jgi:proteic killer suppression protein
VSTSFKHRGLQRLYANGDGRQLDPQHLARIELIVADLDAADSLNHPRRHGYRLRALKGSRAGFYAIDVAGNWRIVFRFVAGCVNDVDLLDYH